MSAILGSSVTGAGGGAYTISNSLRIRNSASAYLSRTFGSGNQQKWTWSDWVKRGTLGSEGALFSAYQDDNNRFCVKFRSDNTIEIESVTGGGQSILIRTTQVFRDPSSWYHFVLAFDTTQATDTNRVKLYINGTQVTAFSTATYPSQNSSHTVNGAYSHNIGRQQYSSPLAYFDGYRSEIQFIGGSQVTPSSFGETNASTGVWQPKAYSGSYGTNGFYLKFSDIATTSGANSGLGKDFSGNGNYWNTNNISVTAGVTYDAMTDSPTPASATVGNFATFSPISLANASTSEANLKVTVNSGGTPDGGKAIAPFGMSDGSGKWYFEMTCVDYGVTNQRLCFGIANISTNVNSTAITNGYYASASGAHGNYNIGSFTNGDVLQVAYDSNSNKLWFGKNGTWYNSGNPASGTTPLVTVTSGITYAPFTYYASSGEGPGIGAWNFGQRPFAYTPPTGFNRLQTYNLPTPTIGASSTTLANKYFDISLSTGNGTSQAITNSGSFQPDFVWQKDRSVARSHVLFDSVRGIYKTLYSNSTSAEVNDTTSLTAFNSNGFSVGSNNGNNANGETFVAWQWKGANGTTSNTSGSITSTVSANTTSGFSVVTYTGTGANATVGHGLGAVPKMIIVKARNSAGWLWAVYHVSVGNTGYLRLSATDATTTDSTWQNTTPTSSVFSIGTQGHVNFNSSTTYVAYCFAEIAGFSKFGSYTGNVSTDGPFVYCGFRPKYLLIKNSSVAGYDWVVLDTSRDTYNVASHILVPDDATAEATSTSFYFDFLSNGFKVRASYAGVNGSGNTIIFAAFAESPFNYSLAR